MTEDRPRVRIAYLPTGAGGTVPLPREEAPSSSWRTRPLPRDWPRIRERVLRRDARACQTVVAEHPRTICARDATQVDHVVPASEGGGDEDANLAAICERHHRQKTAGEGGRASARARPPRRREREPHPGMVAMDD